MSKTKKKQHLVPIWSEITPSQGIKALIDGIQRFRNDPKFIIDMETYGTPIDFEDKEVCVGCAATCAVFQLMDEEPTHQNINRNKHPINGFTRESIVKFESSIDLLRSGYLEDYLDEFPNISTKEAEELVGRLDEEEGVYMHHVALEGEPADEHLDEFIKSLETVHSFLTKQNL